VSFGSQKKRWAPEGSIARLRAHLGPLPTFTTPLPADVVPEVVTHVRLPEVPAGRSKKKTPEGLAKAAIVRALKKRGWTVKVRGVGSIDTGTRRFSFGTPGEPDLEVLPGNGRTVFLEVKRRDGGVVSPAQARWHERHRAQGYVVEVVRTPEEAIAAVEKALGGGR
jgi:hypothetical protein